MEEAITGDFALIKAWKADKETFYDDCLEGIFSWACSRNYVKL